MHIMTLWPFETKRGLYPSLPPPVGSQVSLLAILKVMGIGGSSLKAVEYKLRREEIILFVLTFVDDVPYGRKLSQLLVSRCLVPN